MLSEAKINSLNPETFHGDYIAVSDSHWNKSAL